MDKYLYMRNMMFTALKTVQFENMDGKKLHHIGSEIFRRILGRVEIKITMYYNQTFFNIQFPIFS